MLATQTVLQYNGVRLQNVQTVEFVQTPAHDPSGQYIYTTTRLSVIGYFTQSIEGYMGEITTSNIGVFPRSIFPGATSQYSLLQHLLNQPRRRLIYTTTCDRKVGDDSAAALAALGTPLFIIEPAPIEMDKSDEPGTAQDLLVKHDIQAGPTPGPVKISALANDQTWRVEFTVEFNTASPCLTVEEEPEFGSEGDSVNSFGDLESQITVPTTFTGVQRKHGILSNRWSCTDKIDDNGYTQRTYAGQVRLANPNWNPNDFRAITLPPLVPGMMRRSIDYVASEDNLTLRYTIHDSEVTITAPEPARNIKITHNEGIDIQGANIGFTIRVMLNGTRYTNLNTLRILAEAIVEQRLFITNEAPDKDIKPVFIIKRDYTTEQGTDGNHTLMYTVTGKRYMDDNIKSEELADVVKRIEAKSFRSLTWRLVGQANTELDTYNNVLSFGNREGETPTSEGSIPALACLHAKLVTPCSDDKFAIPATTPDVTEFDLRADRQDALKETVPYLAADVAYLDYPVDLSLEITNSYIEDDSYAILTVIASEETKRSIYNHYNITSTYGVKGLNVALPFARTDGLQEKNNVMVQIGPQQYTRMIRIVAERVGDKPRVPDPLQTFTEEEYDAASASDVVTFTLHDVKYQYLEPSPVADGVSLLYTTYMDLVYFMDKRPKYHRFGVPDNIRIEESGPDVNQINNRQSYEIAFSSTPADPPIETDIESWNT